MLEIEISGLEIKLLDFGADVSFTGNGEIKIRDGRRIEI